MNKEKVWVWFKGGNAGGAWMSGFIATQSEEGGIVLEHKDFVTCRVPAWRISSSDPTDKHIGPDIPKNAIWKYQ